MLWLVVRFRGRDKTPSIIDWDRQQRPSHRQATSRAARPFTAAGVATTGDGTAGSAQTAATPASSGHRDGLRTASAGTPRRPFALGSAGLSASASASAQRATPAICRGHRARLVDMTVGDPAGLAWQARPKMVFNWLVAVRGLARRACRKRVDGFWYVAVLRNGGKSGQRALRLSDASTYQIAAGRMV